MKRREVTVCARDDPGMNRNRRLVSHDAPLPFPEARAAVRPASTLLKTAAFFSTRSGRPSFFRSWRRRLTTDPSRKSGHLFPLTPRIARETLVAVQNRAGLPHQFLCTVDNKRLRVVQLIMSRNLNKRSPVRGHAFTNQRRLLLELLRDAEGHVDAKELLIAVPLPRTIPSVRQQCTAASTSSRSWGWLTK